MVRARRTWLALTALALPLLLAARAGPLTAHPLHTTLSELAYDARTRTVRVSIRVFADDLARAADGDPRARGEPDPLRAYLLSRFELRGSDGRGIPLKWQSAARAEDLLIVRLAGVAPRGLRGGSVRNDLVSDLFNDQVNVLKIQVGGRARTLLFTRGSGPKRIP